VKKTFYFIRHGQTDLNLKGIVQGRAVDSPLNETGHRQARAFYEAFRDVPFDKVYTSTLLRTKQTVRPFLDAGVPTEELSGLDEISWGIYEGKEQDETVMAGFEAIVTAWRNNELDTGVPGGESPNELVARQKEAVRHMLAQEREKTVLVCMHGRALRIMLCHLTGTPVRLMDDFPHTNTALYVLVHENGAFSVVDHYNVKHLENL